MKFTYPARTLGALAILAGFATPALAYTGENLSGGAKINLEAARNIALKAQPGKIADEELEKEAGGSGLRYSFDIKSGAKTHEVGVDAVTGAVLENSVEGANPD
nr:PepSY domain-containing protein [uncultured Acidocella sp.]